MKIGLYVMGKKGYYALSHIIKKFGIDVVGFVVCSRDINVVNDWYDEICKLCISINSLYTRGEDIFNDNDLCASVDYRFAIGWRWIIPNYQNLIIFHDSLLPRYRGFAPLVCMMIEGEKVYGVTALIASEKYDEGMVICQESINVDYEITISELIDLIIPLYCSLISKICNLVHIGNEIHGFNQDESKASYSLWRDNEDYFIDWSGSASNILRFINAVGYPYLGAATICNDILVRILSAKLCSDISIHDRKNAIGKVFSIQNCCPVVVCGEGLLKLLDVRNGQGEIISEKIKLKTRFRSVY